MKLSTEQVADIIEEYGRENAIVMPPTLREDLRVVVGEEGVRSFSALRIDFCTKIKAALQNPEMGDRYGELYGEIGADIRLLLLKELDLETYLTTYQDYLNASPREFLVAFLRQLPAGKAWSLKDFDAWFSPDRAQGKVLNDRLRGNFSKVNKGFVEMWLGEEHRALLTEHPFVPFEFNVNTIFDVRRYLKIFLEGQKKDSPWNAATLEAWDDGSGVFGYSLLVWIRKHLKEGVSEAGIRAILGDEADAYLSAHPFEKREVKLRGRKAAQRALVKFLLALPEGVEWTRTDLAEWRSKDGATGYAIEKHIRREQGELTVAAVSAFLGQKSELLVTRPFSSREKNLTNPRKARTALVQFILSLPVGPWSVIDMQQATITDSVSGSTLYAWLLSHLGDIDRDTLRTFLREQAFLLDERPFEPKRIPKNPLTSRPS